MGNDLFEKAPIPKAYFSFALPVVFSMVISLVYNMADTYFIAATGNTNLVAGVSLGAPIFTLMIALGDIFGLGGSSVISRLFGKKMDEDGTFKCVLFLWSNCMRNCCSSVDDVVPCTDFNSIRCKSGYRAVCIGLLYLAGNRCSVYYFIFYAV